VPTPVGRQTNDFLVMHLGELFDVKFTAGMEEKLDEIEAGKLDWHGMMAEFYAQLVVWLAAAKTHGVEPEKVKQLLELLGGVQTWAAPKKVGKRTYSDQELRESILAQLAEGKACSDRQWAALQRMAHDYLEQIPALKEAAEALGINAVHAAMLRPAEPASPATLRKLEVLKNIQFGAPRKFGKRTFDDKLFYESLSKQATDGRGLSEKQIGVIDRMLNKYHEQIPDFAAIAGELGVAAQVVTVSPAEAAEAAKVLGWFRQVKTWREPVQRGRRTWDDKSFFDSLARQFGQRKQLSPRQLGALKKMIKKYAEQLPPEAKALIPPSKAKAGVASEEANPGDHEPG
jgi:hypothetical protein